MYYNSILKKNNIISDISQEAHYYIGLMHDQIMFLKMATNIAPTMHWPVWVATVPVRGGGGGGEVNLHT